MPIKKTDFYVNKYTDTDLQTLLDNAVTGITTPVVE